MPITGSIELKEGRMKKIWLSKSVVIVSLFYVVTAVASPTETPFKTLVSFNGTNGAAPYYMSLIWGSDGNAYGTTSTGGAYDVGTVFKITPAGVLTTLYSFCVKTNCPDGAFPQASLVQAPNGDFYGTTEGGGKNFQGSIFKMTSSGELTTLHSFAGGVTDGAFPSAGLAQYRGDYYGTTVNGGANNAGTVFKITPAGKFTLLYSFCNCGDGANPFAGLVQVAGNLYGTTEGGGANSAGTVFEITPEGAMTTLHSFTGTDGYFPYGGLLFANDNLYGTTEQGGQGIGTVFQMSLNGQLTTLYSFCSQAGCADGYLPFAGLILGADGNLYGTTDLGGTYGDGTIFEITLGGTLTTLHSFDVIHGANPEGGLLQGANGNLYGATTGGGSRLDGTIFGLSTATER
jgi:uncharacterized repeat protein (TIGR03803 family)